MLQNMAAETCTCSKARVGSEPLLEAPCIQPKSRSPALLDSPWNQDVAGLSLSTCSKEKRQFPNTSDPHKSCFQEGSKPVSLFFFKGASRGNPGRARGRCWHTSLVQKSSTSSSAALGFARSRGPIKRPHKPKDPTKPRMALVLGVRTRI